MYPELIRISAIDYVVPTYGVALVVGFCLAVWTGVRLAKRDGMDGRRAYDVAIATVGASLVGSKLMLLITEPELLDPSRLFSREVWSSGGVYFGGFLAAFAGSVLFAHAYELPWWRIADAFAPAIALGQAIGRLGCFAAGCCWGTACGYPWAVTFPSESHVVTGVPAGVPLHPVQLYESALVFAVFVALMALRARRAFTGQVVLAYLVLYSAVRFTLEFWRDDPRGNVLGLTAATGLSTSQMIAVGCAAAAVAVWFVRRRDARGREGESAGSVPVDAGTGAAAAR